MTFWLLINGYACLQPLPARAQEGPQRVQSTIHQKYNEEGVPSFAEYFRMIGEPPELKSTDNVEMHAYRLVWSSANSTSEIVVLRLAMGGNGEAKLFVKVTSFDGKTILVNEQDNVPAAGAKKFLELIQNANFWELPTREMHEPLVKDGTYWYLEGVDHGRYHSVYRRTPESNPGPFTEIGRYLAKDLAQLEDSKIQIPKAGR